MTDETVGGRVKRARLELGLSQGDLAGPGLTANQVGKIERGERPPTQEALASISARLGLTVAYLEHGTEGLLDVPAYVDSVVESKDRLIRDLRRRLADALKGKVFQSIEAYYAADEDRRQSPEVDFGVMWVEGRTSWPQHRVSWVEATGEVYSIRLANPLRVEVIGWAASRDEVEDLMDGWDELFPSALDWARSRFDPAPAP